MDPVYNCPSRIHVECRAVIYKNGSGLILEYAIETAGSMTTFPQHTVFAIPGAQIRVSVMKGCAGQQFYSVSCDKAL